MNHAKGSSMKALACSLAATPIIKDIMNPKHTFMKSLADILRAYKNVFSDTFLIDIANSLPAKSPIKHQVVLMGIFEYILKTNKTIE